MTGKENRKGGPEKIGAILERVLEQFGRLKGDRHQEIAEAWREVAGEEAGSVTRVISYRSGTLTVGVESAPLFQELETYRREELFAALRERISGIGLEQLRFKLV